MGQVQSRQDEHYFKLDGTDKDALLKRYTELASSARGGKVLETSDELFGEGFHLIKEGPAIEDKNRETANGFWKDGWETRRHNKDSHHTAIIQLAAPGTIAGFDVDTSFFDGSHPAYASIEGAIIIEGVKEKYEWKEILPKIKLNGNSHHIYGLKASDDVYTHVRLNMYPDGGIARLRVFGNVSPIFPEEKAVFNLSCLSSGARVIKTSDDRYGKPSNLILPTKGANTRDGWQTRRSRKEGHHDWVEIKLGAAGLLETLEVDTTHFRGNNPDFISLDACTSEYNDVQFDPEVKWTQLLSKTEIEADKKNIFSIATGEVSYTHVRLNIFPDGGISRVRVFGVRVPEPIAETVVAEETVVDELKVVETEKENKEDAVVVAVEKDEIVAVKETITTTTTAAKKGSKKATTATVQLTTDISSVETLVGDEIAADVKDETATTKKTAAKRGRPSTKGAATAAVAATKLAAGGKKKAKGRSASVLDEEDEASSEVAVSSSPRSKKARE
ncbi:allantoicase [Entomortierella parvispora]|uniref:Allantoicase n=1 Tax=Entomortierella parvispora TaxID=205924 RepID=A0A9P3LXK0_9FUNG|nr:allantoicase [Entomortierella parvispora]